MTAVRIRKSVPERAIAGEPFQVKTLVSHPMDNGFMFNRDGERIPRRLIHRFEATFNGETVFQADWHEAVSENPFLTFFAAIRESGRMEFRWYDDDGSEYADWADIEIV